MKPRTSMLAMVAETTDQVPASREDFGDAEILAGAVALLLAVAAYLLHWGTQLSPTLLLSKLLGLSWFVIFVPASVRRHTRIAFSRPVGLLGGTTVLVAIAWSVPSSLATVTASCLALLGAGAAAVHLVANLRAHRFRGWIRFLLLCILYSLFLAGQSWGNKGYRNPLFCYDLCANRNIDSPDLVFHANVSAMVETYGVASTGLDGLPYFAYHWGSHWVMAQLSRLTGVMPITFYALGYPILFLPTFLLSMLYFIAAVQSTLSGGGGLGRETLTWWQHCLLLTGLGKFLPKYVLAVFYFYWDANFYSESLAFATCLFLLLTAIAIPRLPRGWMSSLPSSERRQSSWIGPVFVAVMILATFATITVLKVTVSHLALAAFFFICLRARRRRWVALSLLIAAATVVVTSRWTSYPVTVQIRPFSVWLYRVPLAAWPQYILINGIWVIVYAVIRFKQASVYTVGDLVRSIRERRIIDVEFVFYMLLVSMMPTILLGGGAGYGSFYYQCNVQLVTLLGTVALLGTISRPLRGRLGRDWGWLTSLSLTGIAAKTLLLAGFGASCVNSLQDIRVAVWRNVASRGDSAATPLGRDSEPDKPALRTILRSGQFERAASLIRKNTIDVERRLQCGDLAVIGALEGLGREIPLATKRRSVLWIPKTNRQFWDVATNRRYVPLIPGALSGLAMIDGLPEVGGVQDRGYYAYDRFDQPFLATLSQEEALDRARSLGFAYLIELQPNGTYKQHDVREFKDG